MLRDTPVILMSYLRIVWYVCNVFFGVELDTPTIFMELGDFTSYNDDFILFLFLNMRKSDIELHVVSAVSTAATTILFCGEHTQHANNGSPTEKQPKETKSIRIKNINTIPLQPPIRHLKPRPKRPSSSDTSRRKRRITTHSNNILGPIARRIQVRRVDEAGHRNHIDNR